MRLWAAGLVLSLGPSCALLYDFDQGAGGNGGGPTGSTSVASSSTIEAVVATATADTTTTGTVGASTTLVVEGCALLGGSDSDLPGQPALALVDNALFYTGTYIDEPIYFGTTLPKIEASKGRGVALAVLDPSTFDATFIKKGQIISPGRRTFVTSTGNGVLFGGTFVGEAHFLFSGSDIATANDRDGFLLKYGLATDLDGPIAVWDITAPGFVGGSGVQGVTAAFETEVVRQPTLFVGGLARGLPTVGGCASIDDSVVLKGFVREAFVPSPTCTVTTAYNDLGEGHAIHDMVVTQGSADPRPFYVADQVGDVLDGMTPGYGRVFRSQGTGQMVFDGSAESEGRVRLTSSPGGEAFFCATRYACASMPCGRPENQLPVHLVSGRLDDASNQVGLTTGLDDASSFIECNAIAYQNGEVLIGGRFKGAVKLETTAGAIAELVAPPGDEQAFVARYAFDGSHVSAMAIGGPGVQDITTLLPSGDETVFIAGATGGELSSQSCTGAFAGDTDVFLMRATMGDL